MKFSNKSKLSLVITLIALSHMSHASSTFQQPDVQTSSLTQQFDYIKDKTINSGSKISPQELEDQLQPVLSEVRSIPNLHEHLVNQLLEITSDVAEKNEVLKAELASLNYTAQTSEEIAELPYELKETILRSLGFESVTAILDRIGEKIFSSKKPFKIPEGASKISQLDMFFLLGITLTLQEDNPIKEELHSSLMSCVGAKSLMKLQSRLNKPVITDMIPTLQTKFFGTRNPMRVLAIARHISNLTETYN